MRLFMKRCALNCHLIFCLTCHFGEIALNRLLFYMPKIVQIWSSKCTNLYNFRYTLLRQVYISSWSKLYKFVQLGLRVQICTLLTRREVYKFVHSCQFSAWNYYKLCKILPKFKANNACMLNFNFISVKVCILLKS